MENKQKIAIAALAGAGIFAIYKILTNNNEEKESIAKFIISTPVATPSNVSIGEKVNISVNLTNPTEKDVSVNVNCNIYDDGFLWLAGGLLDVIQKTDILCKANKTTNIIFEYTVSATQKESRDVGIELIFDSSVINTSQKDNIFTVNTASNTFIVSKPYPDITPVNLGDAVKISIDVNNLSSTTIPVTMKCQIYRNGFLWLAGGLIENMTQNVNLIPGTKKISFNYITEEEGSFDVGIELWYNNIKYDSQNDDIFRVGEQNLDNVLDKVSVVYSNVEANKAITATVNVKNNSSARVSPQFKVLFKKSNNFGNTTLGDESDYWKTVSIEANETKQFTVVCTRNIDSSWAGITTLIAMVELKNSSEMFDTQSNLTVLGGNIEGNLDKISVTYSNQVINEYLVANVTVKNNSSSIVNPAFRLLFKQANSIFRTVFGDNVPYTSIGNINSGETKSFILTSGEKIPSDWAGLTTLYAYIEEYQGETKWDEKDNMTVSGGSSIGSGILVVSVYPDDVIIKLGEGYIDNNETIYVTAGTYNYEISASGYVKKTGTITIIKNTTNYLTETLTVVGGKLKIVCNVNDATIRIGSTYVDSGNTYYFASGTYTWTASADGYAAKSGSITVYSDGTVTLTIKLINNSPVLTVDVYDGYIEFYASGFTPYSYMTVKISSSGQTINDNASGNGTLQGIFMTGSLSPGNYLMYAQDSDGNYMDTIFEIE